MSNEPAADELTLPIKRTDGETIEERLTGNAYHNILPARYLRKNSDGELVEQQEDLFGRVAKNIALAEAVFEARRRDLEVTVTPDQLKPDHPRRDELAAEVFGTGVRVDDDVERPLTEHNVNKFAYETVVPELPPEVRDHVETTADEFQEAMEMLSFTPNCVPPDSLVAAGGGLKPISDVEPGERVYDDEDGTARVERKYDNGKKRVLEVETTSGYTVRATPEHYFRVITADGRYEWRQLKNIEPADTLAVQKNFLDDDGEPQPLDWQPTTTDGGTVQVGRSRGSFQPPAAMTSDLAEWLGLYIGDGTARDSGVRVAFDESDPDLLGYWVELTESVFGFEPITGQHHDGACLLGRASRPDLSDFLEQNDLLKANSRTATVPASVLRSGRSSVAAFLRGLFEADGTVGERQIELYTHSERLGRQVQKLLLGLGIRSRLSERRDGYRLSIRKNVCGKRFVQQVGFLSERKRERATCFTDVADNATSVKIPNQGARLHEWFQESDLGLDAYRDLSQFLIDPDSEHHQEIGKGIFEQYAEQYPELWSSPVADLAARDQFYERVERVSTVGTMAVEDMQVPRRNTYVVEGFVSHNSPTLMNAGDELQQLSACIAGHAPVYTRDGLKRMDQVEPGDNVLTHEGRFKPVVDHWSNGEKSTVELRRGIDRGSSFDTQLTPDHEVYTDDGRWVRADMIGNPADPVFPSDTEFPERIELDQYTDRLNKDKDVVVDGGQVKLRNADDQRTPEFDQQNNQPAAEINNDRTLGWLFGLYLAEGDVYGSDLRFTIGTDETELRERLVSSLKQTFNLPVSISDSSQGQWVQIRVSSSFVADLFATVLGVGGDQKRIPEWVGAAEESYQQAVLDGLLDGDGTELETARRLVLANPTLVYEATLLARSLGYEAVFKLEKERDISSGPTSECYISTAENPRLSSVARRKAETVEVYDMEVADDHSFVVGDFIVHNCFVDSPEDDIDDIHQTAKEAAQVFQCLTEDATVRVEGKGMVSVSEVEVGDRVVQQTDSGFQHRPVEETHAYEDAETLTVRLANGLTVRGTPNHRLMVDDSWTRLDEIQAGQEMHYALGWLRETETDPPELASVASGGRWGENRTVENAEIRELHREGLSDYEIAERLDCGKSTVQRRRSHELGLSPNGDSGRNPGATSFDERAALDLYRDGHTDSEVADQLGVHPTTVSQFRAREQLDPNGKPAKTVRQPEHLDETLAELVGLWVGDGSWHQDGVRFRVKRESIAEYIDQLSRQLFGTSASVSFADGCYEVIINSHEIRRWWDSNFDCKPDGARSARVPRVVRSAPANVVESFLRGYFTADGTLLDGTYPKLYSSSERAIDDVASLMMGLGYPVKKSVIRDEDAHPYFGVVPTTGTGRKAFLRDVGFIDERRETALSNIESVAARDSYVIGDEYTVEVDAVVESDPATVYDITVEDNHEYVADGIVSHNSGGGMGYAFWRLRPYGDAVGSTGGIASGPVTFMRTYDQMCETIAQGGARRGAQMGVMRVSHPDVIQFIHAKNKDVSLANTLRLNDPDDFTHTSFADALEEARDLIDDEGRVPEHLRNAVEGHLSNFNISVGVTDRFMEAVENDETYTFTNPRTEEPHVATEETVELYEMFGLGEYVEAGAVLSVPARELWDHIIEGAHENGEPGVIYLERVNNEHSFDVAEHPDHRILSTNPCVTGDTLISTEDGLITAEELYEQGVARDIVVDGRLSEERVKEASSVYRTGEKEVYRLTTAEGYELRLTADHRVMTDDGWVEAQHLDAGDTVHIQNRKGEFGQHGSAAEGRVLGWLVGDGHLKNGEERAVLNFYDGDTEISEQFAKDVNEIVREPLGNANYEVGVSDISRSDNHRGPQAVEQRIRSVRLYEYAEQAGLARDKLQVPEAVVRGSEEMARGFLQALFTADGHVEGTPESGFSVRLTSIDPDLLRNVQRLLANFGIRSQIYQDRKSGGTKELPDGHGGTAEYETTSSHQLAISSTHLIAFEEEIGFLLDEKQEQLSDTLDEYGRGPYVGRFEATVESVEHDGTEQVYDLTEPDTHSFIANGIIVHNCGEQPLEEYEACNLGHINLSTLAAEDAPDWRVWSERHADEYATQSEAIEAFLEEAIDWEAFDRRIELGTRFLENVVTMSDFPVEQIEQKVREMRKIGLGIMGLAQLYIQLGTKYGSETANEIARQLMVHINHHSKWTSHELATERGTFAEWDNSKYADPTEYREWFEHQTGLDADEWADGFPIRNHNTTTIAPTGTTSMVGNTTGGCEPIYNVAYYKNVSDDVQGDEMLVEFDDYFLRVLEDNGIDVEAVKEEAKSQMATNAFDGVDGLSTVPDAIGELFVTTGDLSAKQHASVQCACQQGVDSAISKCLEEGTLIQTDSGVRPIESFTDDQPEQGTFAEVTENVSIDGVSVESQYYAGEKNATRVRVDNGTELVGATESHKVLTPDGWTVLGELDEGDYVIGQRVESHGNGGMELMFTRPSNIAADGGTATAASGADPTVYEKDVALPETMSARLSKFLGMYAADGSAVDSRYSIEISTSSERVRDEASALFAELFGREPTIEKDTRGGDQRDPVYGIVLNSKPVWEFVTGLCGSGAYNKTVPVEVLRGSPEEKLAFINGVTLDGYVSSQSLVVYGGMSVQLADGVAELLRSFGVPKVYVGRKWVEESGFHSYQVHVTNEAQELVTPVEPHKRVDRFDQRYRVYVPRDEVDKTEFASRSTEYYAARSFEYRDRNYMFNTTAEKLGISDAPPLYEVTELEDAGTREMYDIELAGPHEYVVGGIVSHNTVNAPNDSTVEDAKEVFEYIYDHGGKGVTYYRDGTRSKQVLTTRAQNTEFAEMDEEEAISFIVEQIDELFGGIEGFLENEEIRERLSADIEALLAEERRRYAQKKPRPDQLHGVTQRIDTGYGKLYVTINEDPETGEPFELFANTGHSGGFTNSFTDALAKTISVALRSGVEPDEIVDKLQGIRSPKVAWDKGEQINSIPDAFGTALRRYLDDAIDMSYPDQATLDETASESPSREGSTQTAPEPEPETDGAGAATRDRTAIESDHRSVVDAGENPECPECGSLSLYYSEGCKTCESCGWSEC